MAQRTFTVATTLQDPLSAERLVEALQTAGIDAFTRDGGAASSAAFAAAQPAFYDVLVASEQFAKAEGIVTTFQEEFEQDATANSAAAEAEFQTEVPKA